MKLGDILLWPGRMLLRLFLAAAFSPKLVGRENIPSVRQGRTILIANHISKWDAVFIYRYFAGERLRYMGKHIIFGYWRPYAWLLQRLGVVKVDEPGTGMNWLVRGTEILQTGRPVCIFPAGDRSFRGPMLPFRPGFIMLALNAGADILPMYIDWGYGLFKPVTLAVGQRFSLREFCDVSHPDRETIGQLSDLCLEKVLEQKKAAEAARGQRGRRTAETRRG